MGLSGPAGIKLLLYEEPAHARVQLAGRDSHENDSLGCAPGKLPCCDYKDRGRFVFRLIGHAVGGGSQYCRHRQRGIAAVWNAALATSSRRRASVWIWTRALFLELHCRSAAIRSGLL